MNIVALLMATMFSLAVGATGAHLFSPWLGSGKNEVVAARVWKNKEAILRIRANYKVVELQKAKREKFQARAKQSAAESEKTTLTNELDSASHRIAATDKLSEQRYVERERLKKQLEGAEQQLSALTASNEKDVRRLREEMLVPFAQTKEKLGVAEGNVARLGAELAECKSNAERGLPVQVEAPKEKSKSQPKRKGRSKVEESGSVKPPCVKKIN